MLLNFSKGKTIESKTIENFRSYSAVVEKVKMIEVKMIRLQTAEECFGFIQL